jgi:hypothetical protein
MHRWGSFRIRAKIGHPIQNGSRTKRTSLADTQFEDFLERYRTLVALFCPSYVCYPQLAEVNGRSFPCIRPDSDSKSYFCPYPGATPLWCACIVIPNTSYVYHEPIGPSLPAYILQALGDVLRLHDGIDHDDTPWALCSPMYGRFKLGYALGNATHRRPHRPHRAHGEGHTPPKMITYMVRHFHRVCYTEIVFVVLGIFRGDAFQRELKHRLCLHRCIDASSCLLVLRVGVPLHVRSTS